MKKGGVVGNVEIVGQRVSMHQVEGLGVLEVDFGCTREVAIGGVVGEPEAVFQPGADAKRLVLRTQ